MPDLQQSPPKIVIACFALGYWLVRSILKKRRGARGPEGCGTGPGAERSDTDTANECFERRFRDTLGVAAGASIDEIRAAYRLQFSKYHPDKVAHLGAEFYDLASARTKEIIDAYAYLKNMYASR